MILLALGSNLVSEKFGEPRQVCEAALRALSERGIAVAGRSRWYRTAPVPVSEQPWYVNGVVAVETELDPGRLLETLHAIENEFGRVRQVRNEARVLDLDLLAYHDVLSSGAGTPILPHPRLHERAFVLLPLSDVAPDWRHPRSGLTVDEMIRALPGQTAEPMTP